nr:hypothetical protein [uncultured bacterium]
MTVQLPGVSYIGVEPRFIEGAAYTKHLVDEAASMKQLFETSKIQPIK